MTFSRIAVAAAVVAVLAACSGSRSEQRSGTTAASTQTARPAPDRSGAMGHRMSELCPMDVPDTKVTASDTSDGEALTFTTTSGQVDELRRRVRAMADMHNQRMSQQGTASSGADQQGTGAGGEPQGMHGHHGMIPGSHASAQDVDNGVRVNVVPDDPAQADRLRTMVRKHAELMQSQGCGMMHRG